jgi:flagellar basal-body rod protein FlgF
MDGFFNAYQALDARMKLVDAVANNLANAQTTGFKRDFSRILQTETGFEVASQVDLSPGELVNTGNELDAAIDGEGFFVLQTPDGPRYTRSGSFSLNADGELMTKDGAKVLDSGGSPIVASGVSVAIQDSGIVTVDGQEAVTLKIVTFTDKSKLQKEGLYRLVFNGTSDQVQPVPEPRVKGGHLERSNVNPVTEMVHLMNAYREFEAVQRTVKTLMNDMNGKLIQELGRLT